MFRVEILTGNAAFEDGAGEELARILRGVADVLTDPSMAIALEDGGTVAQVKDVNGDTVGQWIYTAE